MIVKTAVAIFIAHISLQWPPARTADQKQGPCGKAGSKRGKATVFKPGSALTLKWDETVNHPSHYRISFAKDGDAFPDPASFDERNGNALVVEDGIADKAGGAYTHTITLPSEACDNCTLQLIQVMTDKPPYGDGNDIYYQCADVKLSEAEEPSQEEEPAPTTRGGCGGA
jgi:predicted carbohydrate-binding protein with CBM5 and CBM33 domain